MFWVKLKDFNLKFVGGRGGGPVGWRRGVGVQEGGGAWGSKKSNHDSNLSRQIFNSCSHTISHIWFFQVLYLGYGNI